MLCHICGLESKPNLLLSSHYRAKHKDIAKDMYKTDLYIYNGRPPKICKVCDKPTKIPKGEGSYPEYHSKCYIKLLKSSTAESNANWKGGKITKKCDFCSAKITKHSSSFNGRTTFCSVGCSTRFYYCKKNGISISEYEPSMNIRNSLIGTSTSALKRRCFKAADYICDICGVRGGKLNAHHKKSWKFHPEDRNDINNLVCLCQRCHINFHKQYGYGKKDPLTEEQYEKFKKAHQSGPK